MQKEKIGCRGENGGGGLLMCKECMFGKDEQKCQEYMREIKLEGVSEGEIELARMMSSKGVKYRCFICKKVKRESEIILVYIIQEKACVPHCERCYINEDY